MARNERAQVTAASELQVAAGGLSAPGRTQTSAMKRPPLPSLKGCRESPSCHFQSLPLAALGRAPGGELVGGCMQPMGQPWGFVNTPWTLQSLCVVG